MSSGAILLSVLVVSTLCLAIWAQGHANQHHQSNHGSHGAGPDPKRPFLTLWRKRGHNAVNYQYNMHKPVQNGQVNQRGSVTLFKPKHKDNQPDRSGFLVSYRMSQDFDSTKPLQHNQNNRGGTSGISSHGSPHDQSPVHHQSRPSHRTPTQSHHPYRNDDHPYRNANQASNARCYDTINSNQVFCCSPSYNGGSHQRCWRQNNGWEGSFF